jgi:hypothetical protein
MQQNSPKKSIVKRPASNSALSGEAQLKHENITTEWALLLQR